MRCALQAVSPCAPAALLGTLVSCVCVFSPRARTAAAPVPAVRPMYFEHLTMRDGLSQSTVEGILQDSRGYLWMATESGLDRYDGNSIRVFRRERGNPQALASDYIWTMAEDAHGDLWLATIGGGVERWQRSSDSFQQFRHDPATPHPWPATRCAPYSSMPRAAFGPEPRTKAWISSILQPAMSAIFATGRGFAFIARRYRACSACRSQRSDLDRHRRRTESLRSVRAMHSSTSTRPRAARAPAICACAPSARTIPAHFGSVPSTMDCTASNRMPAAGPLSAMIQRYPHSLSHDRVPAVLEDDAQQLWVATDDGLNLFDRESGTFARYGRDADNPQSLRDSDIMSLYQDRGGVLWVGTRLGGASHWNPRAGCSATTAAMLFATRRCSPSPTTAPVRYGWVRSGPDWSKSTLAAEASGATARVRAAACA